MAKNHYETDLDRNPANYQALTPITFLERSARIFPDRTAIIHGKARTNYAEFYTRARKLASSLAQKGIGKGDTVSAMLSNTPSMLEAHYGVPMTGAILHSMNTRLDATVIAFQIDHAETDILITDREFSKTVKEALSLTKTKPLIIDYDDPEFPQDGEFLGELEYEEFIATGDENYAWARPDDEWNSISLNYTSGTTGNPKGVVYHHRGAALMCYSNTIAAAMDRFPVYLWTLPMFHCNGWCYAWSLSMVAGVHVCLRAVRAKAIYDAIADHKVTHLSGAPIVMSVLLQAGADENREFSQRVAFAHAAAPPPKAVLIQTEKAGFDLTHLYGLTETYGPAALNEWKGEWDELDQDQRMDKKMRQGVGAPALEDMTVLDPGTMDVVTKDGETMGEVMFRGNILMKGYLKNKQATEEAFAGGWFHSGDLGVLHGDDYIQIKDRSKDIIISGGENISSIEVEDALYKHPAVSAAAVVAKPDDKWGETPCAFVETGSGANVSEEELIKWCREELANFKCPKNIVFTELPKTSTGKIQKFKLREMAKDV
jgi:fatty-acyl-CoA synthase